MDAKFVKFRFKIVTRNNFIVDKLIISSVDLEGAQRKLEQMYRYCQVLECEPIEEYAQELSFDKVLDLVTRD